MILQNALMVNVTGEIIVSTHRHDFVSDKSGRYFVDGGHEYLRRTVANEGEITDLSLSHLATQEELIDKLVWGTYGKSGKEPRKWVLLKNCETDHLEAILKIPGLAAYTIKTIKEILKRRASEELKKPR